MLHASVILLVLGLVGSQDPIQSRDARAIEVAKNTEARAIDASLPQKRFELWLRDLVGSQAKILWEVNDCGEQTGDPSLDKDRDFPMCAEAQVVLKDKRKLHIVLPVGTFKTGIRAGPASFFYAVVVDPDGSQHWVEKLSGIQEAIK
jgi:hypothetical protein